MSRMTRCALAVLLLLLYENIIHGEAYASPALAQMDVVIDVGHGGIDPGTMHGTLKEKDINLLIAKKLYTDLDERGYRVVMNRIGDYALSEENRWLKHPSRHLKDLRQRNELSKAVNPRAVISLHVNWSKNAAMSGAIVLRQNKEPSKRLAASIQQSLNTVYGTRHDSQLGKTYFLLNHGPEPSVIVEMGFISNDMDRNRLTQPDKQKELARAIADGISAYFDQG
jgi:N-acetylmuramoyl-L-alanine amidase